MNPPSVKALTWSESAPSNHPPAVPPTRSVMPMIKTRATVTRPPTCCAAGITVAMAAAAHSEEAKPKDNSNRK